MKRILSPADFSAPGQAAMQFAADLAERTGAQLLMREYVTPAAEAVPRGNPASEPESGTLRYWVATHDQLDIQVDRVETTPEKDLLAICQEEGPDLVVLGATGTSIEPGVLSDQTARLARHIECPLLVVERPARLPVRRVLFVSDFSEPEADVMRKILSLIGVYEPEIHLLYVKDSQYLDMPLILAESVMRDFEDLAVPLSCHSHVAQGGSVSAAVSDSISRLDIDLVALGNQPRSLLYRLLTEDVLARVLRDTDAPVLIVPR